MLNSLRAHFEKIPDFRNPLLIQIPLADFFMSAFAIFSLKMPSLLKLDEERAHPSILPSLYKITRVPSDTQMRTVLDEVPPVMIRPMFKRLFVRAQRAKVLEQFKFLDEGYLVSADGSGYFFSDDVHCEHCLTKKNQETGKISYYHQMLTGAIVCPGKNLVVPFCPEPIKKQPGETANDSEQAAMERFIDDFRREHPKLKVVLVTDALHAHGGFIRKLNINNMSYILSVKPGSHEKLFEALEKWETLKEFEILVIEEEIGDKIKKKRIHEFRFKNRVLLNHSTLDVAVNFLDYRESTQWVDRKGRLREQKRKFSWVTDIELTKDNVFKIMRGGRSRWKIENETFNTLKNQGYEFEHNFGHGRKHLTDVFAFMMMLVFMFDQLSEASCKTFQAALKQRFGKRIRLWEKLRGLYECALKVESWRQFMEFIAYPETWRAQFNTS